VLRLPLSDDVRPRSARDRARHRERAFAAYFALARVHDLAVEPAGDADAAAVSAMAPVDGRALVGVQDERGETLGLAAVGAIAADGRSLSLLTPVPPAQICGLSVGSGSLILSVLHEVRS
jgi:polynucleotide 5'-kinase involved in rRNA processing